MTTLVQHQQPHQESSNFADSTLRHPTNMQQPETAKNIHVYKNGDQHFPAKKFVVNKRHVADFNSFLNMVTNGLKPSFGAVRNIYTPNFGHRVHGLQDINNNMVIVAGGSERFRKLQYKDITAPRPVHVRRTTTHYEAIRPVYHNAKMNVAARWKYVNNEPCLISVFENGDDIGNAVKVLLVPRTMKIWNNVLQEVTDKLAGHSRSVQAIQRLYTTDGTEVTSAEELQTGKNYVGVGAGKFKHVGYGKRAKHMTIMNNSPRRHNVQLPPIRTRARVLNSTKPSTYSQQHEQRKQHEARAHRSQPPPDTTKPPNRRLRPIRGAVPPPFTESESVFHAKPVKVKRSDASGKVTAVSAMEENEDDVFRGRRQATKAEEVADDEDTKVDLPIDQVPADTVEEEEVLDVTVKQNVEENQDRTPPSQLPKPTYATRLEEADTESSKSIKTPSSAKRDEPQPSARASEEPEPSARSIDESETNGSVIHSQQEPEQTEKLSDSKVRDENKAAVIIQSRYRGYRTRKDFEQQKLVAHLKSEIKEDHDKSIDQGDRISRNSFHHSEKSTRSPLDSPTNEQIADQKQAVTSRKPETPVADELAKEVDKQTPDEETSTFPAITNVRDGDDDDDAKRDSEPPNDPRDSTPQVQQNDDDIRSDSVPPNDDRDSLSQVQQDETEFEKNDHSKINSPVHNEEEQPSNIKNNNTADQNFEVLPAQKQSVSRSASREGIHEPTSLQKPQESQDRSLLERDDGDGVEETPASAQVNQENVQAETTSSESGDKGRKEQEEPERPVSVTLIGDGETTVTPTKSPPNADPIPNGQPTILAD